MTLATAAVPICWRNTRSATAAAADEATHRPDHTSRFYSVTRGLVRAVAHPCANKNLISAIEVVKLVFAYEPMGWQLSESQSLRSATVKEPAVEESQEAEARDMTL